jgi:hypothetical protein
VTSIRRCRWRCGPGPGGTAPYGSFAFAGSSGRGRDSEWWCSVRVGAARWWEALPTHGFTVRGRAVGGGSAGGRLLGLCQRVRRVAVRGRAVVAGGVSGAVRAGAGVGW